MAAPLTAAATLALALAALDLAWLDAGLAPRVFGGDGDEPTPAAASPATEPAPAPAPARAAAAPDPIDAGLVAAHRDAATPPAIGATSCDEGRAWDLVRHVYFERGSAELSAEARRRVDAVARRAEARGAALLVEGHTDRRGSKGLNDELSAERAEAVAARARAAGVAESRLVIRHFGERHPIARDTSASRWRNRRVSLCFSDKQGSP